MNPLRIRRVAAALAGLACAWLGLAVTARAAFALPAPPAGYGGVPGAFVRGALLHGEHLVSVSGSGSGASSTTPAVARTVVAGGMPGWQIALMVAGAALLAAAAAVLIDRTWAARRRPDSPTGPAVSKSSGQPDEDRDFQPGRADIVGDDADLIGTADLAVPRVSHAPR